MRINRQFNVDLAKNPKEPNKWLEFIALQDRMLSNQQNLKTLTERKLSIA